MPNFNSGTKLLGVDVSAIHSTQQHELGTRVEDETGRVYEYVTSTAGVTANSGVKNLAANDVSVTGANDAVYGVAHVAITATYFGWIVVRGIVTAKVVTGVAQYGLLSLLSAANSQLAAVVAVAEGGAANHVAGAQAVRAKALAAEAANLASVFLF